MVHPSVPLNHPFLNPPTTFQKPAEVDRMWHREYFREQHTLRIDFEGVVHELAALIESFLCVGKLIDYVSSFTAFARLPLA
jgi:hypothetical protein